MNLVLTGFMGTGKTAVGRRVADELNAPFFDADREIVKKAGRPIAEIFSTSGESAFRALEAEVIAELAQHDKAVISTGGGALLSPQNRAHLEHNGLLVCLTAKVGTLVERLKDDFTRPLLAGEDLPQRLERLMKEREAVYAACPIQIVTDGKTIAQVTEEIVGRIVTQWSA